MDDLFDLERLQDVVVGTPFHRIDGGLDGAEACHDHGEDRRVGARNLFEQLDAAHARHLQVADDQVVAGAGDLLHRGDAIGGSPHHVAFHAEEVGEDVADELLVIDDQDPRAVFEVGRLLHQNGLRSSALVFVFVRVGTRRGRARLWGDRAFPGPERSGGDGRVAAGAQSMLVRKE